MRLCVVSSKECWQEDFGKWASSGGFPFQIHSISSLFDETELVVLQDRVQGGGVSLSETIKSKPVVNPDWQGVRTQDLGHVFVTLLFVEDWDGGIQGRCYLHSFTR